MTQIGTDGGEAIPSPNRPDLSGRIATGAAWIVAARFMMRLIGLANTLIVARLLLPQDFGLVAIAFTAVQILQGLSDFGAAQAVVRFRDADRDDYNTIWTFSMLRGLILALVMAAIAWPASHAFNEPRLVPLFLVMAFVPLLEAAINPRFYEFERNIDFTREFIVTGTNKFLAVAVSITLALVFRNYWALVGGVITGTVAQLALSYFFIPFRPRFSFASHKKIFGFSGWLAAAGAISTLNLKLDALIIARMFGTAPTGGFYLGMQLAQMTTNELATPVSRALFPGLSEQQGDALAMRRTCLGAVEAMAAIAAPMAFGMGFVAHDLVPLLFGDGWDFAVPVLQYVAPCLGLYFITDPIRPYVIANGETKILFIRELIYMILRLPSFILAAIFFGYIGAVIARALAGVLQMVLNLFVYSKVSGRSPLEPLQRASRSLLSLGAMSVWFVFLNPLVPHFPESLHGLRLLLDVMAGATLYGSAHLALWHVAGRPQGVESILLGRLAGLWRLAQRWKS